MWHRHQTFTQSDWKQLILPWRFPLGEFVRVERPFLTKVTGFRDEKSQLLVGVRRATNQQTALSSSVLSTDSMHIGVLAAAAHAASSGSSFTIYYNPRYKSFSISILPGLLVACLTYIRSWNLFRTSPSPFVVPVARYNKANYIQQSVGMRMAMMFETEESSKRRFVH